MAISTHLHINDFSELGIWDITEDEQWFTQQLSLFPHEQQQLDLIKGKKRIEWLAARHLVHTMSGRPQRGAFIKDQFGKPFLDGSSHYISISHSHNKCAAIASQKICGIDIQFIVPKITRIAPKFMRPEEMNSLNNKDSLLQLHIYWGAKEALYKAYGRKQLDFKQHIIIEPFTQINPDQSIQGWVIKNEEKQSFSIQYQIIDDYILTFALRNDHCPPPPFVNA